MSIPSILNEAKALYDIGFAIHWIRPNSKAPVKAGWTSPERDPWEMVAKDYRLGYGLGVRLGQSSKVHGGYLANIDVDIKSSDPKHRDEAYKVLEAKFPNLVAPTVKTGYGLRLFVKTKEPLKSGKLASSSEECVVLMPNSEPTQRQHAAVKEGLMTADQLKVGYRVRPSWELEFMSAGRQVVLPPSIHPDTKMPYIWEKSTGGFGVIPLVEVPNSEIAGGGGRPPSRKAVQTFKPVAIDLTKHGIPDTIIEQIQTGEGVLDRSAALLPVAKALFKAGLTRQEVLSVLTDSTTYLGETAYDHAKTKDRHIAAAWLDRYTVDKAENETNAALVFDSEVVVTTLDEVAAKAQEAEIIGKKKEPYWKSKLDRTEKGALRVNSLKNIILILTNVVSPKIFLRDEFASRDSYSVNTPWGGKKGEALTDDDGVKIKYWLSQKYSIEPSVSLIYEAMIKIATSNGFHPVRDELNALPPWDGVNRLDGWLKAHFEAKGPDEYLAQVLRKWMVASVKRTFEPGAKFDWMIIFEGEQGIGKSMFGSILFGQRYFSDWLPKLDDKDAALGLQSKRCIEFGELDQLRRNEVETIKAFVARQVDNVRPPYGKRSVEIYRQSVFIGSTNKEHYLKDDTGNRRFNPVMVGGLDFNALKRDRNQLWAEALFIYQNDLETNLELEDEAKTFAIKIQRSKLVPDEATHMAEDILELYESEMQKPEAERFNFKRFKLKHLFVFNIFSTIKPDHKGLLYAAKAVSLLKLSNFIVEKKEAKDGNWWKIEKFS